MSQPAALNLREQSPVAENIERPDTLSQTLMAKHDKCPHSAYLYRRLGGGKTTHALTRGTAVHVVAEVCQREMIEQGEPTIPGDVATTRADEVMAEHPDWVLSAEDQDVVRRCIYNWAEATVLDLETLIGIEVPMQIELGGFLLRGRLDRLAVVGQSAYGNDLKSSLNIRRKEEVEESFQGHFYGMLALFGVHEETGMALGAGLNDFWFYEEYPRYRTDEGPLVTREAVWSRAELYEFKVALERNIEAFASSLETGLWPARDGSWCGECPAQRLCPIPAEVRELPEITTQEEAEALFSLRLRNRREGEAMQRALREWAKATEEPIYSGDYAFDGRRETVRKVKDWDQFLMAVERTVEFKVPLEAEAHIDQRDQVKFDRRKRTEEERDD